MCAFLFWAEAGLYQVLYPSPSFCGAGVMLHGAQGARDVSATAAASDFRFKSVRKPALVAKWAIVCFKKVGLTFQLTTGRCYDSLSLMKSMSAAIRAHIGHQNLHECRSV